MLNALGGGAKFLQKVIKLFFTPRGGLNFDLMFLRRLIKSNQILHHSQVVANPNNPWNEAGVCLMCLIVCLIFAVQTI